MTNYLEILRLNSLGISKSAIAESLGCSRTTVITTISRAEELDMRYPFSDDVTNTTLKNTLFPSSTPVVQYEMPDYDLVYKEMQRPGVTLNLLWIEYCERCAANGKLSYKSTQFNKYYRDYLHKRNATMHIEHKPGEIMQVDWAGDTASLTNTVDGSSIPIYIFVATLAYSGYSYVEGFTSMNEESWIAAHVNAYRYFGGCTRIIQCDNLKTGVIRHGKDEIELNTSYRELAEHYGTAIVPARVRKPKDKAFVEGTVGVISTYMIASLRNIPFFTLIELNRAIRKKLDEFNHKPFQKKDGSRASVFEEEKEFMLPLPAAPYETATWKQATVALNYHVYVDHMYYSVPFEYIRQKVDVRLTRNIVEVFFEGNRICSHKRLYGHKSQYSTIPEHMPPEHRKYAEWNGERFLRWASKYGNSTVQVIRSVLSRGKTEQQGYKSCIAILKLAEKYSGGKLEVACRNALHYSANPSFKQISKILENGVKEDPATIDNDQYGFTRGDNYYGRAKS